MPPIEGIVRVDPLPPVPVIEEKEYVNPEIDDHTNYIDQGHPTETLDKLNS